MNYYCILVETGKEDAFKKAVRRKMESGEFDFSGSILIFRHVKKIVKLGKVYDEILFPGYVFFKTEESDVGKFRVFSRIDGFLRFLPDKKCIEVLAGRDLEIVSDLEQGGEFHGFLRVRFDENDKVVIVSGSLAGLKGRIVKVNRRNHKINMDIVTTTGIRAVNLSYFDIEKEDWSEEEESYIAQKNGGK